MALTRIASVGEVRVCWVSSKPEKLLISSKLHTPKSQISSLSIEICAAWETNQMDWNFTGGSLKIHHVENILEAEVLKIRSIQNEEVSGE